jgi:ribose transport system substrate-binding protein
MEYTRTRTLATLITTAALAAGATGCGGDDGSTAAGGSTTAGGSGDAGFTALPAPLTTPPDGILITEPLSKRPPAGKTVAFVGGQLPLYSYLGKKLGEAVKPLGWKAKVFLSNDPAAAMTSAINAKVDYIWGISLTKQAISGPLAQARKAGIPVVNQGVTEESDPDAGYFTVNRNNAMKSQNMVDWIINDSKGKANVLLFTIRSLPYFDPAEKRTRERLAEKCPGCKLKVVDVTLNEMATSGVPAKAVSAIQSTPGANYAAFAYGDMMLNVANTVKAAGLLDKVKLVSVDSVTSALLKEIERGDVAASGVSPNANHPFWLVDIFARMSVGDDLEPSMRSNPPAGEDPQPVAPWIVAGPEGAKATSADDYGWDGPANGAADFKKLWGVAE